MFGKFCQSLLSWFSGAGCVDNHNFKTLNYDDTSGPLRLSTQSFSTGWCLPAFGFYILLSSIVSLQEIVKMICFWAVHILNPCCSTLPWIGLRRAGYTYIYIYVSLSLSFFTLCPYLCLCLYLFFERVILRWTPDILPGRLVTAPPQTRRQRWIWFAEFACVY